MTDILFYLFGLRCFAYVELTTDLPESKHVKQEAGCTLILHSVSRLCDLLDLKQIFKACGNN